MSATCRRRAVRPPPAGRQLSPSGQIADVRIAPAPLTAVTRTDGKASIGISVSKSSSGNTVDIAAAVAEELPAITRDLNGQATITMVVDQSTYIKESITSLWREGLLGAVFAVFVIWAFLRSWRSTLIASLSIPLSVVGALIILYSRGQSLNMLTLGGLTIAIGRVIDDSIVVIENTYRHLQEGDDIRTAAFTGTREVAGAITASTLTTVAVFLPLGFVHGLASEFFRPFALTVSFALLCSLFVALMVVPVASTWVLSKRQVGHRDPDEVSRLQKAYLPALKMALGHKTITLLLAGAIFAGTMMLAPLLKTNLFDNSAQNTMSITQQLPPGTSLDATMAAAAKVEAILKTTAGHRHLPGDRRQHRQPVRRRRRHQRLGQPGGLHHHHGPRPGQELDRGGRARQGRQAAERGNRHGHRRGRLRVDGRHVQHGGARLRRRPSGAPRRPTPSFLTRSRRSTDSPT